MDKHTPGPWQALPQEEEKPYIRVRGARPGSRYKVANVLTPTSGGVYEWETEETRANACLVAAAPELLAALNAMLTHMGMDEDEWNRPTFDQARKAVAKAQGAV